MVTSVNSLEVTYFVSSHLRTSKLVASVRGGSEALVGAEGWVA
jgi:hypothetical protein